MNATPEELVAAVLSAGGLLVMCAFLLVSYLDAARLTNMQVSRLMRQLIGPFWFEEWGALALILLITVLVALTLASPSRPRTPIGVYGAAVFLAMELYILLCRFRAFLRRREVMNGGWRGKGKA